jgi:hypothetical protein
LSSDLTGRRHNAKGRSTGKFANSKFRKANHPPTGEPFIWMTRQMLESPAYRVLSGGGHGVVARVALEHMAHGASLNGSLPVTYNDFEAYGIRRRSIRQFLEEAVVLGFVARTQKGRKAIGEFEGAPALYRVTWLPTHDGQAATNDWMKFATVEDAKQAVRKARDTIGVQRQHKRFEKAAKTPHSARMFAAE